MQRQQHKCKHMLIAAHGLVPSAAQPIISMVWSSPGFSQFITQCIAF